jgi:Recombinase
VPARVVRLRRKGLSYAAIGIQLTAKGIPTAAGRSTWTKSHVARLLRTRYARDYIARLDDLTGQEDE